MARTKIKLSELRDADVTYVSLVDRAASRIPFRVIKREEQMLDLSKPSIIGRILKSQTVKVEAPTIASIAVMDQPEEQMEKIREALTENGFVIDKVLKQEDGSIVFAQDETPEDGQVIRISEDVVVVVKGFDNYGASLADNCDFSELMATKGFFNGVNLAMDALYQMIVKEMSEGDDPQKTSSEIAGAVGKFSDYVITLVKGLPQAAFKVDFAIQEVMQAPKTLEIPKTPEGETMTTVVKTEEVIVKPEEVIVKPEDTVVKMDKPSHVEQKDWDGMDDEGKKKACKSEIPVVTEVLDIAALMKGLTESMAALSSTLTGQVTELATKVDGVAAAQKTLEERVDETARKSDDALKAVKGTVVASAGSGDNPADDGQARKSEDTDLRTGNFDTAFIARRQKREVRFGR